MTNQRNITVDTFKFIAIAMVIVHHTHIFNHSYNQYGGYLLVLLKYSFYAVRFGIPYFFIVGGYFFGKSLINGRPLGQLTKRYCLRLAQVLLLWSLVYCFLPRKFYEGVAEYGYLKAIYLHLSTIHIYVWDLIINTPVSLIFSGTQGHLWFFPAYVTGILTIFLFLFLKKEKYLIPFGFLLYTISLLGGSYQNLPIGFNAGFPIYRGPFVSTLFLAIGWRFSKVDFSEKKFQTCIFAFILVITGLIIQFSENWFLYKVYHVTPKHEFLIGMIPLGIGVFLFSMGFKDFGKSTIFPIWGRYTLGVFALHEMFLYLIRPSRRFFEPIIWDLAFPTVVFLLSFATTMFLYKFAIGRKFVEQ